MSKRGSKSAIFINRYNNISYSPISLKNGGKINTLHKSLTHRYNDIPLKIRKRKFIELELQGAVTMSPYGKLKVVNINETQAILKNLIRINLQLDYLSPSLKNIVEEQYISHVRDPSLAFQVIYTAVMAAICNGSFMKQRLSKK